MVTIKTESTQRACNNLDIALEEKRSRTNQLIIHEDDPILNAWTIK